MSGPNNLGSSPEANHHVAMISVGMNWGLYDTIDVVKYSSNDTLHYPTSLLSTITPPYLIATEQLPVNGVEFPDIQNNIMVSWGVVQGTSTGYIYVWDWLGVPDGQTRILFAQAVDELLHQQNVTGLILDFRKNFGGVPEYANDGYAQLFNIDPTYNYSQARRTPGSDHFSFTLIPPRSEEFFSPGPEIFDHPIAVLTGPNCGSAGDYNAFRMRFHPLARFFGKRTNGAFTVYATQYGTWFETYSYRIDQGSIYSNYHDEGFMIHKGFPVDEEIWFDRDDVARGEETIVKRALEWIDNLSYPHNTILNKYYARTGLDTIIISTITQNPNQHPLTVQTTVTVDSGPVLTSLDLYDDGLHQDGQAGDNLWSNTYTYASDSEQVVNVTITTIDPVADDTMRYPRWSGLLLLVRWYWKVAHCLFG